MHSAPEIADRSVVLFGAESTGKTTLGRALARELGAAFVPEAARQFVEERGRAMVPGDVPEVARLHLQLLQTVPPSGPVVLDTDLLASVVYSRCYFGHAPVGLIRRALGRRARLYLLCDAEGVPFIEEPGQRGTADQRIRIQVAMRIALQSAGVDWAWVGGSEAERLESALHWSRRALPLG